MDLLGKILLCGQTFRIDKRFWTYPLTYENDNTKNASSFGHP